MAKTWRTLDVLADEQKKINEELSAYHQELISRAIDTGSFAGDIAVKVVEVMKSCPFAGEGYKYLMSIYNDIMKLAEK